VPLIHRKNLLKRVLEGNGKSRRLRYSDHFIGKGKEVYRQSCRFALEGIISKHIDSPYVQKRSRQWQKVKCLNRQEFVVGGYTDPAGSRTGIGALLVGTFENGRFIYAGRVGTGFGSNMLKTLRRKLEPLERKGSPFEDPPAGGWARQAHWVKPEMVVEVEFANWTEDGRLRAPSFKGIREDKAAPEVHREEAVPGKGRPEEAYTDDDVSTDYMETAKVRREKSRDVSPKAEARRKAGGSAEIAGVRLTNPGKVLYPEQGITKLALAQFCERVARFAVPHIRGRPLTLVRCPQGSGADCFFQKHFTESLPDFTRAVSVREKGGSLPYIVVDDLPGVISLVQLGALEIHTWTCREDSLEQPDRMVFDLDPDKGVDWEHVIDAALAVRALLEELGLESFLKTTGGNGLHVVVPLTPRSSWEEVKTFSRGVAVTLVRTWPRKYVAIMSKEKRRGKIFIDYFRNGRGATYIAAYSTRSRPGAPVSTPLRWEELGPAIGPDHFNINNLPGHLERMGADPWEGFFRTRQYLSKPMKRKLGIE
jgi:bifunctional non-homologous end joining protein LigD